MKKILFFAVLGALGTAMFTSCSNDDALTTPKSPEQKATDYASEFKAKFGNSSFNTVKTVDVQAVLPSGKGNYTLRVYDGYPSAKAQMLGKFENLNAAAVANVKVNCPGNASRLFFTAEQNGMSKISNCGITKTNKVVAKFDGGEGGAASIDGTFDLNWSNEYAQFSKAFYDKLPSALTTIAGLFDETENHANQGADALFAFNKDGEVVFYPIFQNQIFEDNIGYFIMDVDGNVVEEGTLIENTQDTENPIWWRGNADGPVAALQGYYAEHPISGKADNYKFAYSKPYVVTAPEGYDPADLVVGITVSNAPFRGFDYMYGETYYSYSALNAQNTDPDAQIAVYASGQIETTEVTPDGEITTTRTFGLVGIEDNLAGQRLDWDMNDVVFFTEATQVTTLEFEKPALYYVAFEDLGGTYDFDFNDVVLGVYYVSGQETATVQALAAGGILPVEVYYNQEPLFGGELHGAFGVPENTVVNTIPEGQDIKGIPSAICEPLEEEIPVPEEFLIAEDALPFVLYVNTTSGQVKISARGEDGTPQALVIGTTWTKYPDIFDETGELEETGDNVTEPAFYSWQWPIECAGVDEAYPDIYDWVADPANFDWLETGVDALLFPEP